MDGNYTFLFVSAALETESITRGSGKTNGKTNSEFPTKTPHLPSPTQVETKMWKNEKCENMENGKISSLVCSNLGDHVKVKTCLWSVATLGWGMWKYGKW